MGQHFGNFVLESNQATARKKRRFGRPNAKVRAAGLALPGLDLRSVEGRRYAAVVLDLVNEYGDNDMVRLRELAGLRVTLEQTQVEALRGSARAREDCVRISNMI